MPRPRHPVPRPVQPPAKRRSWRRVLLTWVTSWNRYQVGRVIEGVILTWLIGAIGLFLVEGPANNPGFDNFVDSL